MKSSILLLLLFGAIDTLTNQPDTGFLSDEYESCCGTQPVEFSYEQKRIYVPNVFTPNKDGVNDYFYPVVNDVVTDVWGFAVYSAEGDTMLYQKPYFNSKMPVQEYGWDGLRPDGSRYKGAFRYKMRVDDVRAKKDIVEGRACAIICGSEAEIFRTKSGCYFPAQGGKEGILDKSVPNGETDCF